ncbi:hypothetical protein CDD81_6413 [Ophiocordyceps australis]|uniref:Polyketide synthase-like methyltransferase domain-containing protein n=1 Tax=Ophiocordyceps australis TaxID=1399860 RepID=A0A2C5XHN5_9HYPO|nr:hypothetical protein CDD81_6413 [Ophiocordyceps australis]
MPESWTQQYARSIVCQVLGRIQRGRLTLALDYQGQQADTVEFGEEKASYTGPNGAVVVTIYEANVWVRLCQAFDLGFAEAYMLKEVDCDNLIGLFSIYLNNQEALGTGGNVLSQLIPRVSRLIFNPTNTVTHARLNASFHYDTSNTLFSSFLGPTVTYSCAIWSGAPDESLESAQERKIQTILDKLCLDASHHVLDIGCGWGTFAIEAARQSGCRVTGITLSAEQRLLAQERIQAAGLQERIEIVLCDYRQAPRPEGGYHRIVSLEMIEHVGDKHLDTYFETVSSLLEPKAGIMVIQDIVMAHQVRIMTPDICTFIDRYVFPGGYIPTVNQLLRSIHDGSGGTLEIDSVQSIGPHYIHTLQCWRQNFLHNWERIRQDFVTRSQEASEQDIEAYRRRWLYYFEYCEAGFRARTIGDAIIVAARAPWPEIPSTIPH